MFFLFLRRGWSFASAGCRGFGIFETIHCSCDRLVVVEVDQTFCTFVRVVIRTIGRTRAGPLVIFEALEFWEL